MKKSTVLLLILLVIVLAWVAWKGSKLVGPSGPGKLDNFAKCLSEKGVAMYGASWCSHCQNQKKLFGSSWQYVNYVECAAGSGQAQACKQKGITGYPTWDISGELLPGEITLQALSEKTGCVIG